MPIRVVVLSLLVCAACTRSLDLPPKPPAPGSLALVLAANGAPLAGATARIATAGLASRAGADGAVRFGGLPEGSYILEATSADGAFSLTKPGVSVFAGKTTDLGQVALVSSGALHGKAGFGAATGNAGIVVFLPLGAAAAVTADDGTFHFANLTPGSYQVRATAPGHQLATSAATEVQTGKDADAGTVTLAAVATPRLGSISGTVQRLTARGLATNGISVTLSGAGRAALASEQGSYSLGSLPEGRYSIVLSADGAQTVTLSQVPVSADAPTVLPAVVLRDASGPDLDGDGIPDDLDPDIDGDGVPNELDAFPRDPTEWADSDGDGIGDNKDNCKNVYNPDQADLDHDGIGDACQPGKTGGGPVTNLPPSLSVLGRTAVNEGELIALDVSAADPEGKAVTLVLVSGPAAAVLASTGAGKATVKWQTASGDAGTWPTVLRASDGVLTTEVTVQLVVAHVVSLPALSAPARLLATAGLALRFTVTATHPSKPPAITVKGLPASATFSDDGQGTGSFAWTPGAADAAAGGVDLVFTATVTEGSASTATRVDVYPAANQPPVISFTGALAVDEGQTQTLSISATDPDHDPIALFASGAPANASFADAGNGTGTFTFKPGFGQAGVYTVQFVASDGKAVAQVPAVITVRHVQGNTPPTLLVAGPTHLTAGQPVDLTASASDPDVGQTLTLTVSGAPAAASFVDRGGGSGVFHWATTPVDKGTLSVTFLVTDGQAVVQQVVVLTIDKLEVAPVLAGPLPNRAVSVGTTLTVDLTATDQNLDPLSFSFTAVHAGASLADHHDGTARFTFVPTAADYGATVAFVFSVSDGSLSAQQSLQVFVPAQGNQPPIFDPVAANQLIAEGATLTINVRATDADFDPIALVASALPAGATLTDNGDGTGKLVYAPGYSVSSGANVVVTVGLTATDGRGGSGALSIPITVTNTNRPPAIVHHADVTTGELSAVTLVTSAADPDGSALTYSFSIAPGGLAIAQGAGAAANTAVVTTTYGSAGPYLITATASDGVSQSSDLYNLVVQAAQSQQVRGPGGASPVLGMGVLVLDQKHNQLVYYDPAKIPADTIYLMALDTPATQKWTARSFPPSGCGAPCFPPNSTATTTAQGVVDQARGALFLFRNNSTTFNSSADNDVWRLDLTPGAEAWNQVSASDPFTGGCGAPDVVNKQRTALIYNAANDSIVCEHFEGFVTNGAAWLVASQTQVAHTTSGAAAALATGSYQWASDASQSKTWALLDDGTANRVTRVVEITPGNPSTSATLVANNTPPLTSIGAAAAVDSLAGRMFVFGGVARTGNALISAELLKFDFASGLWSPVAVNSALPAARMGARMLFVPSQKLLYIGGGCAQTDGFYGRCNGSPLSDLWVLDVSTATVPPRPNRPPIWDLVAGNLAVAEGATLTLNLRATDPDADAISFAGSALPANASFTDNGDGTARLVYQPGYAVSSGANVAVTAVLTATDARGASTQLTLSITVTNVNRAPVIQHHLDLTIGETASVVLTTAAADPDGTALNFGFSVSPGGLSLVQGSGAAANTATVMPPLGSAGTYKITATASDGSLTASDVYNLVVQVAQLVPVQNLGGATPPLGSTSGTLVYDPVHNRLVFVDTFAAPDTVWLMPLSTPAAQTWTVKTFSATGCGGPCYPTGATSANTAQGVMDARRGALYLFRSNGGGALVDDDAWRLDLTPGAEAWSRLTYANPYLNGCGQTSPSNDRTALIYHAANDTVLCEHLTTQPLAGAGWTANGLTLFPHATAGAAAAATASSGAWSWDATNAKVWGLLDDGNTPPYSRVVEITPGYPSSSAVTLAPANSAPLAAVGASIAVDAIGGRLYAYGGAPRVGYASASSDLFVFDLTSGLWSQLVPNSALPTPRSAARMLFVPSQRLIYLGGGCSAVDGYQRCYGTIYKDLWALDVSGGTTPPAQNHSPAWNPIAGNLTVAEGATLVLNVQATDADADPISLSVSGGVANAAFVDNGGGSGKLTYSPGFGVSTGIPVQVAIPLTASDAKGGTTTLPVFVTVTNVNRAPAIAHHADVTIGENSTFVLVTSATDPDGSTLSYGFSAAPSGLSMVQGSGASANTATVTAAFGSVGTYAISATASDGSAVSTDSFSIIVQPAQVRTVPNLGGAAPVLADGILVLDQKYNQLVFYDAGRAPDTVYLMALGATPAAQATQTWAVKTFPPSGCGTPCYPPNSSVNTHAQGAVDQQRGALFVFRSNAGGAALDDDVWRLDLNPATALTAAWTRVSTANPYTNGCGAYQPGQLRTPLLYSAADDAIYCEHLGAQAGAALGWNAGARTSFAHATTGAAATTITSTNAYAWDASNTKAWALVDDAAAVPLSRIIEITPGTPSAAVTLASSGTPPPSVGAALGVDSVLRRGFVFGGQPRIGYGNASDDLYRFDFAAGTWTQLIPNSPRPPPRVDARMVYVPSQKLLYVGGGCSAGDGYGRCNGLVYSDLWTLNVDPASGGL